MVRAGRDARPRPEVPVIPCLVITGDPAARDLVKTGLEQTQACEVDVAEDAWALELCETRPYRIVVADGTLGDGADGMELLRKVREKLPDAELVLVTRNRLQARYLTRDKQQVGLYGYFHLPVDALEFFKTVARLLERLGALTTAA
jgi:CheY-like chemotaxis protein